jgi:hypothetical protein
VELINTKNNLDNMNEKFHIENINKINIENELCKIKNELDQI